MPGLVISAMTNPFRRLPRIEYVYGAASAESLDPVAPLLDNEVYDNAGLIVISDTYSVWPDVGAFPRSESYQEVLDKLVSFAMKRCEIRLSPRLCRSAHYAAAPWSQLVAGWRFTGLPGDAEAFIINSALSLVTRERRRFNKLFLVMDPEADTGLSHVALQAAAALSFLLGAELRVIVAEPRPYPYSKGTVELRDVASYEPGVLLRFTAQALRETSAPILEPRTPLGAKHYTRRGAHDDALELTLISASAVAKEYYLLLAYQACGAKNPLDKITRILSSLVTSYIESTQLVKKRIGGTVVHHLGFNTEKLRALLVGAAAEKTVLTIIKKHQDCDELYSKGLRHDALNEIERFFQGSDKTPEKYVSKNQDYMKIENIKRLRRLLD